MVFIENKLLGVSLAKSSGWALRCKSSLRFTPLWAFRCYPLRN